MVIETLPPVLMSIRPAYADEILAGRKTVELRRRRPTFALGTTVFIYMTSPFQLVVGAFEVGGVISGHPDDVWSTVQKRASVDRAAYDAYFAGAPGAYGIEVENVRTLNPVSLTFRPPQSYLILRDQQEQHRALLRSMADEAEEPGRTGLVAEAIRTSFGHAASALHRSLADRLSPVRP